MNLNYNNTPNSPCTPCSTECKDVVSTSCITYSGTASTCQSYMDIDTDMSMNTVIQTLMAKICDLNTRLEALEP